VSGDESELLSSKPLERLKVFSILAGELLDET